MKGWVKIHRKMLESPIFTNANMLKLWMLCLMKASHKEHEQLVGQKMIKLNPGEFVTGRNALAEAFNKGAKKDEVVSAITLWRYMKNFEKWQMLNIKTTNKFSVISIKNWVEYQETEQQVNNKRTASEQQVNTNKNEEECLKNEKKSNKRLVFDEKQMKLAELLWKYVQMNDPSMKKPNLNSWANTIRLMMERDEREGKEIQEVILWATQDDFWHKNILSADKLRKQYDKLKIQMKSKGKNGVKGNATSQPSFDTTQEQFKATGADWIKDL